MKLRGGGERDNAPLIVDDAMSPGGPPRTAFATSNGEDDEDLKLKNATSALKSKL